MVGPGFRSHTERGDGLLYSSTYPVWCEESRILFRELQTDLNYRGIPTNCDLSSWAKQGVLMLNTSLSKTVGENLKDDILFHDEFWEDLILEIAYDGAQMDSDMVFVIIGDKAIDIADGLSLPSWSRCIYVDDPLKKRAGEQSFIGSRIFTRVNQYLKTANKATINWSLPGCNKY
jgi:uracil-DNA glycosylase